MKTTTNYKTDKLGVFGLGYRQDDPELYRTGLFYGNLAETIYENVLLKKCYKYEKIGGPAMWDFILEQKKEKVYIDVKAYTTQSLSVESKLKNGEYKIKALYSVLEKKRKWCEINNVPLTNAFLAYILIDRNTKKFILYKHFGLYEFFYENSKFLIEGNNIEKPKNFIFN